MARQAMDCRHASGARQDGPEVPPILLQERLPLRRAEGHLEGHPLGLRLEGGHHLPATDTDTDTDG